jgi:hypothetical protein
VLVLVAVAAIAMPSAQRRDGITVTGTVAVIGKDKPTEDNSNVVVWLEPRDADRPRVEPLRSRPRMVQRNKSFEPYLFVVTVGSSVEFPNVDPFFHNVFSPFDGKRSTSPSDFPEDVHVSTAAGSRGVIRFRESTRLLVAHKNKYRQDYVPGQPGSPIYIR